MANKIDIQRLKQLELILQWEGGIGNARLRQLFNLSSIRASQWLKEFKDMHPRWVEWDSVSRTHVASAEFYRNKTKLSTNTDSLSQYLSVTGLPSANKAESSNVVVSAFQEIVNTDSMVFSTLTNAAKVASGVEIIYRSMGNTTPHICTIFPHSIVLAGKRWHVRAFSEEHQQFRDFAIGRISKANRLKLPSKVNRNDDKAWMSEVNIRLTAHPELSVEQESIIRFEYFANTSARVVTCRGALVHYFIQDAHAATDVKTQRPPEYLLAVQNIEEVSQWLFSK